MLLGIIVQRLIARSALSLIAAMVASAQPVGWLHLKVMDSKNAVIPGIRIAIREKGNDSAAKECISNELGECHYSLPYGVYLVSAESENFFPYSRAPVVISPSSHKWIAIVPRFLPVTQGKGDAIASEKHEPLETGEAHLPALISFERKEMRSAGEVYLGDAVGITWGQISANCSSIERMHASNAVRCVGPFRLFNGISEYAGQECYINFSEHSVTITREPVIKVPLEP